MLISSIHITQLDMAFQHFPVYTRLQDPDIIPPTSNTVLELQIKQLLDAGFTDISIASYLNYVANNPNINPEFPAIKALALAKIQVLANEGEVDTTKHAQVIRLLSDIQQTLTDIATLTVADFKEYLLSKPLSIEDANALDLKVLDLSEQMLDFASDSRITTAGALADKLIAWGMGGKTVSAGTKLYDFGDCAAKLCKMGLLDRIHAGLLLKRLSKYATHDTNVTLGELPSQHLVSFLNLNNPNLNMSLFLQDYYYVEELVYVLTHNLKIIPLVSFNTKEILQIAKALLNRDFITQDQFDQILVKYNIPVQEN